MEFSKAGRPGPPICRSTCFQPSSVRLMLVILVLLVTTIQDVCGQAISAVVHLPTMIPAPKGSDEIPSAPESNVIAALNAEGQPKDTATKHFSQFLHLGCFFLLGGSPDRIVRGAAQDESYNPNACIELCHTKMKLEYSQIIAAVMGPRCGCSENMLADFEEADPEKCEYDCGPDAFDNPYCGGPDGYWGVFKQYDYQSLATAGGYDPWRHVFYTVVVVKEETISGREKAWNRDSNLQPERYYLHAVNVVEGHGAYQYQSRLPGIAHGLLYDLDDSRLVGMLQDHAVGRTNFGASWVHYLFVIDIDTTDKRYPLMRCMGFKLEEILTSKEKTPPVINIGEDVLAMNITDFSGTTALVGRSPRNNDAMLIFTIVDGPNLKQIKSLILFVRAIDASIAFSRVLDFTVLNLMSNEKTGVVTAVGSRFFEMQIVNLAMVTFSVSEDTLNVRWIYTPGAPDALSYKWNTESDETVNIFGDMWIHPGLSCSEHLYNKTFLMYRNYSMDWKEDRRLPGGNLIPMTLLEINVANPETAERSWCGKDFCDGSVSFHSPYTVPYNMEPRIPLSLEAPKLLAARFNAEGSEIRVKFSKPTLKGAVPVDLDNDIVPDIIDYDQEGVGFFDCATMFDEPTIEIIGPFGLPQDGGTQCYWEVPDMVSIILPAGDLQNIDIGYSLYLLGGRIYTVPRPEDGEYSMSATGGVKVSMPDPVPDPVLVVSGSTMVDQCSDLELFITPSLTGGKFNLSWALLHNRSRPPIDTTNSPIERRWNWTKVDLIREILENATEENMPNITIPTGFFEPASKYYVSLYVESRWGTSASKQINITKMDYPAPTVSIAAIEGMVVNRTMSVNLPAIGEPTRCAVGQEKELVYKWAEATGKIDLDDEGVKTQSSQLQINPFTLHPAEGSAFVKNHYNFTVMVYSPKNPQKSSMSWIELFVQKSPIKVVLTQENIKVQQGTTYILDARYSEDLDYPQDPGSQKVTFQGLFTFWCQKEDLTPCFNDTISDTGQLNLTACPTDPKSKINWGGHTFSKPVWSEEVPTYCKWAKGVLMVRSKAMLPAIYKFTVAIEPTFDFPPRRKAIKSVNINVTAAEVAPNIALTFRTDQVGGYFSVQDSIRIQGTPDQEVKAEDNFRYYWKIFRKETNPDFKDEEKQLAEESGTVYNVPQQIWVDNSDYYGMEDPLKFKYKVDSPDLMIEKDILDASNEYKVELTTVSPRYEDGEASIEFRLAGKKPTIGEFYCVPEDGAYRMPRKCIAKGTADDRPLSYQYGEVTTSYGVSVNKPFDGGPSTEKSDYEVLKLPIGKPANDFVVTLWVEVCTTFNACAQQVLDIRSRPPEDVDDAVNEELADMENSKDPAAAMKAASTLVNLVVSSAVASEATADEGEEQEEEKEEMSDSTRNAFDAVKNMMMNSDIQQSPSTVTSQFLIVADMSDAGYEVENTLDLQEKLVGEGLKMLDHARNPTLTAVMLNNVMSSYPDENAVSKQKSKPPPQEILDYLQSTSVSKKRPLSHRLATSGAEEDNALELNAFGQSADLTLLKSSSPDVPRRKQINHRASHKSWISDCPTAFCDRIAQGCYREVANIQHGMGLAPQYFRCCDKANPYTLCGESSKPCWHKGITCPSMKRLVAKYLAGRTVNGIRSFGSGGLSHSRRLKEFPVRPLKNISISEFVRLRDNPRRRPSLVRRMNLHSGVERRLSTGWGNLNYCADEVCSTGVAANNTNTLGSIVYNLENIEGSIMSDVKAAVKQLEIENLQKMRDRTSDEQKWSLLPDWKANEFRKKVKKQENQDANLLFIAEQSVSQSITRLGVMRDNIIKRIISQMPRSAAPIRMTLPSVYTLWFGKTTNLSDVSPVFQFPDSWIMPGAAPESPSEEQPNVYSYSFMLVEYIRNIYGWSTSAPPTNSTRIATLNVMYASTMDMTIRNEPYPIRVFSDKNTLSAGFCMFWDRFAPKTAGGQWSSQGLLNNGDGCLTTHLSDIGLFLDGRDIGSYQMAGAENYFLDTRVDVGSNLLQMAIMGLMVLVGFILALLGYVQDEYAREDDRTGKHKRPYYKDGDGVNLALSATDPIAYNYLSQVPLFLAMTFWGVIKRDHSVVGPLFYKDIFTRPQRIMCLGVMLTGVMCVNAIIFGAPDSLIGGDQYVPAGVLSGLLVYPLYCGLTFMFYSRPNRFKRNLIKKKTTVDATEGLQKIRADIERKTAMLPEPGYTKAPPSLPTIGPPQTKYATRTLLAMPPPVKPATGPPAMLPVSGLPGLSDVPKVALGLPGLPALPPLQAPGSVGRPLPSLPPLPSLKAGSAMLGRQLPPPPKYPMLPNLAKGFRASIGGPQNVAALLPPPPLLLSNSGKATMPKAFHEIEAPPPPHQLLQFDTSHGMQAPMPDLPALSGPPGPPPLDHLEYDGPDTGHSHATPRTPSLASATPRSYMPAYPTSAPVGVFAPAGLTRGIVHRGAPPSQVPPPFAPSAPAGDPPPGFIPVPGAIPPTPPPPPREDDTTFVRRVRLNYFDRTWAEHQKIINEDQVQETPWHIPNWVFTAMVAAPYMACSISLLCHILVNMVYTMKFGKIEEANWNRAFLIGVLIDLCLLDVVRCAITTIVELRRFEIRRRTHAGDFLTSRIKGQASEVQEPELKPRKPPPRKPAVPRVAPKAPFHSSAPQEPPPCEPPLSRPLFLPPADGPFGVPARSPPSAFGGEGGPKLPVGFPKGPPNVPPLRMQSGTTPPGGTPHGTPGRSLLPGRLDGRTPPLTPGTGPGPPVLPGQASNGSAVSSVTRSLSEKLEASRVANAPPPPIPGGARLQSPAGSGVPSRPGSQPTSHRSGEGARSPPKPPTPPPAGTLQQTRASRRAAQQA